MCVCVCVCVVEQKENNLHKAKSFVNKTDDCNRFGDENYLSIFFCFGL